MSALHEQLADRIVDLMHIGPRDTLPPDLKDHVDQWANELATTVANWLAGKARERLRLAEQVRKAGNRIHRAYENLPAHLARFHDQADILQGLADQLTGETQTPATP